MNRRKLLQFMGLGAAAPAVLPPVQDMSALRLDGIEAGSPIGSAWCGPSADNVSRTERASRALAKLVDPFSREKRKLDVWVTSLSPDVYALRSASLSAKIMIEKQRLLVRQEEQERMYWTGVLKGWWE